MEITSTYSNSFISKIGPKFRDAILILLLALIQFSFVVDYILVLPLGPAIMKSFSIKPGQYALLISVYTMSAALAGFFSSFVIDRFARKKTLLFCFAFFLVGNILCVFSNSFHFLIIARVFSGAFGGILSSMVIIYLGDIFPAAKLGRTTSAVMIANGMATVIGVPAAIYFSEHSTWDWKLPFMILFGMSLCILMLCYFLLPDIQKTTAVQGANTSKKILSFINNQQFIWPVIFMTMLTFGGGATILPFLSTFVSHNWEFGTEEIAFMFFCGGLSALAVNLLLGTLIDRFGKQNVFLLLNFFSIIPLILLTTFPFENKLEVLMVTTAFFCMSTARSVSGITLVNSIYPKEKRGRYITITNSIQLLAGSGATILCGALLYTDENILMNFDLIGVIGICATVLCIFAAFVLEE